MLRAGAPEGLGAGHAALRLPAGAALVDQQPAGLRAGPCMAPLLTVVPAARQQLAAGCSTCGGFLVAWQVGVQHLHRAHPLSGKHLFPQKSWKVESTWLLLKPNCNLAAAA